MHYPDEYWHATEIAYGIVYGGVELPWEWTTYFRLRSPMYGYFLACFLWVIKQLGMDYFIVVKMYPYIV